MEGLLPFSPYKREYEAFQEAKKNKKAIVFSDFQKFLTIILFCIYLVIFSNGISSLLLNMIKLY